MFNLTEDNRSIEDLIKYIDSKIIKLKTSKELDPEIMKNLHNLYISIIDVWMSKNYLYDIEPDSQLENQIINQLLELITDLDKL